MGRIQSNIGLITGVDIQKTVDQLIAVSAQPKTRLEDRIKGFQSQQVAINELTALVIGVQLQTDRLGKVSNLLSTTATSSKADVLAVTSTGSPSPGNYAIQTLQTAQTATASSSAFTSASDTLQAGDFVVRTGGFVDQSTSLDELRGGVGIARGKIRITDRSGTSKEVDLRYAASVEDVLKAINTTTGLRVSAKTDGDRIVLSDLTGQTASNLVVEEVGDGRTAADLGLSGINIASTSATGEDLSFIGNNTRLSTLRDGRGIGFTFGKDMSVTLKDGSNFDIDVNPNSNPTSVGQLISAINAVDSSKLEARISADGNGLELIDKTTGSGSFSATGNLADQLGFTGVNGASGTIGGVRIQKTLQGPLLSSLMGGKGIGTAGTIQITNRNGTTTNVDLSGSASLRDVIDRINASGSGVTASLNRSRTGVLLQDVTGGSASNLIVADGDSTNTATKLNIAFNDAKNSVDSNSLNFQFVSEATELGQLNQGRGVRNGTFTITNAAGATKVVNINSNVKTVGDAIRAINSNDIGVTARLNDSGDGILITDTTVGSGSLTITDDSSGSSALDLGIRGTGATLTSPARQEINGSQNFKLSLTGTETLTQVIEKINASQGPVTASLLTSGPSSVRILFSSRASGEVGRIFADGDSVGLNVNSSGAARDALISVGGTADAGGTLVRSSTNTISNAIDGLTLTVKGVDTNPVDITVASSNTNIEKNIQLFVDQFNKVRDKVEKETSFDPSTKVTGQLFGTSEVLRVEQSMARLISQRSFGSGKVQSLQQLGISLNDKGRLEFDKTKLSQVLQTNAEDVKTFFTKETSGFGARAKAAIDTLVGEKNSVLVNRSQSLQRQIEMSTKRVDSMSLRLDRERERLLNQFYAMESNIAKIQSNASGLQQLSSLMGNSSSSK